MYNGRRSWPCRPFHIYLLYTNTNTPNDNFFKRISAIGFKAIQRHGNHLRKKKYSFFFVDNNFYMKRRYDGMTLNRK